MINDLVDCILTYEFILCRIVHFTVLQVTAPDVCKHLTLPLLEDSF
jgi:hypothetical protein